MTRQDPAAHILFAGKGEVRALARDLDWSAPPLGPVAGRPQSLRSTVRTLLSSQYPMILTGGPAFTQIDNDAYAKLVGARHPAALGGDIRVTLAASRDTLGPMIARVMQTGEANGTQALPLLHRPEVESIGSILGDLEADRRPSEEARRRTDGAGANGWAGRTASRFAWCG
jgi:hypothetical protein